MLGAVACSSPTAAPVPKFVAQPVDARPENQTVDVEPSTYAAHAAKPGPLILGAAESGASIRWPLKTTLAESVAIATVRVKPSRGAPGGGSVAAGLASAAVCVALATDIETLAATTSADTPIHWAASIAVATLAAARGDTLIKGTVVFGGLLPDTSVAGLPTVAAIDALSAAGIKRLGIPAGTRSAYNATSKKRVDLVEAGAARDVEVVEVPDLAAAYALMTGGSLPRTLPVASEVMELPGAVERRLETAYQSWRLRLAPEWSRVLERGEAGLDERARAAIARLHRHVRLAESERKSGQVGSAVHRIRSAYANSRASARANARGPGLDEAARRAELEPLLAAIDEAIDGARPDGFGTVGEVIGRAVRGFRLISAHRLIATDVVDDRSYFELEAWARTLLAAAGDAPEIEGSWGSAAAIDPKRARRLAAAHLRAARVLFDEARAAGLDGSSAGDPLIELATARRDHLQAWTAVTFAELLGLSRAPKTGAVTAVGSPKALERLLELADESARRSARAAKLASGQVPVIARTLYQAARTARSGATEEKLDALELYWKSGWLSELVAAVSRK